jgi:hypothetical protein
VAVSSAAVVAIEDSTSSLALAGWLFRLTPARTRRETATRPAATPAVGLR